MDNVFLGTVEGYSISWHEEAEVAQLLAFAPLRDMLPDEYSLIPHVDYIPVQKNIEGLFEARYQEGLSRLETEGYAIFYFPEEDALECFSNYIMEETGEADNLESLAELCEPYLVDSPLSQNF